MSFIPLKGLGWPYCFYHIQILRHINILVMNLTVKKKISFLLLLGKPPLVALGDKEGDDLANHHAMAYLS